MVPSNPSSYKLASPLIEDGVCFIGSSLCFYHAVVRIAVPLHMAESGVAVVVSTIDLHGFIIEH